MPNAIQLALFVAEPPRAEEVAKACFAGREIAAASVRGEASTAEIIGNVSIKIGCSTAQGRIDLFWEPPPAIPAKLDVGTIDLDSLEADFTRIEAFASRLAVNRTACVLTRREVCPTQEAAIKKAREALKGAQIPESATEILYRINTPGKAETFEVNKISLWQSAMVVLVKIENARSSQSIEYVWEHIADVNTDLNLQLAAGQGGTALGAVRRAARELIEIDFGSL